LAVKFVGARARRLFHRVLDAWALKDVDLALGAAGSNRPPLLAALSHQWHAAVKAGLGGEDLSAARLARKNA
jgi:hypothetical protein